MDRPTDNWCGWLFAVGTVGQLTVLANFYMHISDLFMIIEWILSTKYLFPFCIARIALLYTAEIFVNLGDFS